ncbi:MAG: ribose 5-phosphate isomerase [Candidatus Saccharibacteria bacterium]|nr:ribose 5-phosphate isomerase [Candidatus Saccharibacteria bacterium]
MKLFIGTDHNGFQLHNFLIEYLKRAGYEVVDQGDTKLDPDDDFPVFAGKVISGLLASDDNEAKGILICGSGQGMCMAANRFKGIRASLVWNQAEARAARNDDDSNVLCLPSNQLKKEDAPLIVETWLNTPFAASARFVRRIKQMDELN